MVKHLEGFYEVSTFVLQQTGFLISYFLLSAAKTYIVDGLICDIIQR